MSWLIDLYETYQRCYRQDLPGSGTDEARLMPIAHTTQKAHAEIVLDDQGRFRRARLLGKDERTTLIPCTESSGGRSGSKPIGHPLCDKLQYIAADFLAFGGEVTSGFSADPKAPHSAFLDGLAAWSASSFGHPKLQAIHRYVSQGTVVADLVGHKLLPVDAQGQLLKAWSGDKADAPAVYEVLSGTELPEDIFVRWRVEGEALESSTWEDQALIDAWIGYYATLQTAHGFCAVTGEYTALAEQHPAKLRNAGDKAKLISSNDSTGFTFRGRFWDADQAAGVGYDVTQKAHNALRWLITRQGWVNGDQVVVSWASNGAAVPGVMDDSREIDSAWAEEDPVYSSNTDIGTAFSLRLKKALHGYQAKLEPGDSIQVMMLDSATPGRLAMPYYRKLRQSELLLQVQDWHEACAWPQNFGREARFVGAASPKDVARAAFGPRPDPRLVKATCERLLPCIVDGQPIPDDLVISLRNRVSNRVGFGEAWEWEKALGIACGLYKGKHQGENYAMTLETGRTSRDYLYGRLLALAEKIEDDALYLAGEGRDTTAARLMQRFSDRPFSTWLVIEKSLAPYKTRMRNLRPEQLHFLLQEVDEVHAAFQGSDYQNDTPLSGEYLLGYHCQRAAFKERATKAKLAKDASKAAQADPATSDAVVV